MEQMLLANGLPRETVVAIMMLYKNTKVKVRSSKGDTDDFNIVAGVLQGDTLAPYLFIICLDNELKYLNTYLLFVCLLNSISTFFVFLMPSPFF